MKKEITLLRFPLMVAMVCFHSDIRHASPDLERLAVYCGVMDWLKTFVWFPSLMLFFFISGFLFFREQTFTRGLYLQKLKRRVKSLLVPFLLWNGLTLSAIAVIQALRPGSTFFLSKQVADFRWFDFLLVFWDKQAVTSLADDPHGPLLLQFWFIQSLMVVVLFAPVLWLGMKRLPWLSLIILGVLLYVPMPTVAGFKAEAFFYFTLGAVFQLSGLWQKAVERPVLWAVVAVAMMLLCISAPMIPASIDIPVLIFQVVYNVAFFLTVFGIARVIAGNGGGVYSALSRLSGASFFVFALHIFFAGAFPRLLSHIGVQWSSVLALFAFVLVVTVNVCCCLILHKTVKRLTPRFYALLSGNR